MHGTQGPGDKRKETQEDKPATKVVKVWSWSRITLIYDSFYYVFYQCTGYRIYKAWGVAMGITRTMLLLLAL